ncbi:Cytochrome c peroxidase [Chlorella vulgaris]
MLRTLARQAARAGAQAARGFAAEAGPPPAAKKGGSALPLFIGLAGAGGGLYYAKENGYLDSLLGMPPNPSTGGKGEFKPDYDAVRKVVEELLESNEDYDDGSYGPVLVRLAWHTSGTYDKNTNTGGSNGATMRFLPESAWGANAGLGDARDLLEPVKQKFPWISYSDLWTLAGATAVEAMGGPHVPWRPGRSDYALDQFVANPDGRLPDGDKDAKHVRDIFYRMGFNDQEIVALSGAHTLGRCHADRSGFVGPWTNAPTTFSNLYFQELTENKWRKKKWNGPLQYEDKSGQLMMLNTDMALLWDKKFKPYVMQYAKDEEAFFKDFAAAFSKLMELGVPFPEGSVAATPAPQK